MPCFVKVGLFIWAACDERLPTLSDVSHENYVHDRELPHANETEQDVLLDPLWLAVFCALQEHLLQSVCRDRVGEYWVISRTFSFMTRTDESDWDKHLDINNWAICRQVALSFRSVRL